MDTIENVAAEIFELPVSELGEDASPKSVKEWDSMKHISFVLALEQNFDVRFSPSEIGLIDSLGHVRKLLAEKGVEV